MIWWRDACLDAGCSCKKVSGDRDDGFWNLHILLDSEVVGCQGVCSIAHHCHLSGAQRQFVARECGHKSIIAKLNLAESQSRLIEGETRKRDRCDTLCGVYRDIHCAAGRQATK